VRRVAALVAVALLAAGWSSGTATLRVVLDDKLAARPAEGYVWFVGLDKAKPVHTTSAVLHGAAGRHVLVSYIRDCDGNCGYLDPPSMRCPRVVVTIGRARAATVQLRNSGCRIILR
jgi:hypothetical protein